MTSSPKPQEVAEDHRGFTTRLLSIVGGKGEPSDVRAPADPVPGDPANGKHLISRGLDFDADPKPGDADPAGFDWLRDLRAVGTPEARQAARALVSGWIDRFGREGRRGWRPRVTANRTVNILCSYHYLRAGSDAQFLRALDETLNRCLKTLERSVRRMPRTADRFHVLSAMAFGGVCLSGRTRYLERIVPTLEAEIEFQIAPDGGHRERNPERHVEVLADLVDFREALAIGRFAPPDFLQSAIERMAPMARFFRHGDGHLALFNGGNEGDPETLDRILETADAEDNPAPSAPHAGFERLQRGETMIIADAGMPPPQGFDRAAHAGTLSFELSVGEQRIVVNCGGYDGPDPAWRSAMRATAAHSALVVDDTNVAEVLDGGGIGQRIREVICRRDAQNKAEYVDAVHDGYMARFGISHRRRLTLSPDGHQLRGEDSLIGSTAPYGFFIRFHLHPSVEAIFGGNSPLDLPSVQLHLPDGQRWVFQTGGGHLGLEDSVYMGKPGRPMATKQIVVGSETRQGEGREIGWSFERIDPV